MCFRLQFCSVVFEIALLLWVIKPVPVSVSVRRGSRSFCMDFGVFLFIEMWQRRAGMNYLQSVWNFLVCFLFVDTATEMNVLRRSARKSRMERIKHEHIKEIMGVKGKPDITDIIKKKGLQW